ncbi:hypothetical protein COCC4DRAFT_132601 [Bipolaris maydis ATCC 48331]|uniref:Fungal lipase-like domain-containing protein n=2 Tax=Cochliobolus heterostrophus TaxID=5016 RepID=M2UIT4_COCH5|nr:uncharacterized protein COCC4DRAFT_132601 [Bipolaris maydis ATCC 48331]EMD93596.1 hypothetical protein COCHEDRAFT_1223290 [Bipolaris maydis C5]KAJ5027902.1 hypothetical protein J3E73DRAFT_380452 [Bipolaris maydis]ENI06955.1 hypothetical protein COCC4DRAFT_132601 [Bipolaris maydis ATCC 48331]KAJ5062667.1 hypothetical protein J3E74DRAFT_265880 [Bipolaris maydis]KAJ6198937.1 hypothetical protein J3E72DRAFT_239388 [Bipolaris maydis]
MDALPKLSSQYLDFKNHEEGLTEDDLQFKALTLYGASIVSSLCYEDEFSQAWQGQKFQRAREANIISEILPVGRQTPGPAQTTPLLAWSVRLQTVFIGFRGTQTAQDVMTSMNVAKVTSPDLATSFHSGFFQQAYPFSVLVKELADKFRVVVCGHSLGGALATIAAYHAMVRYHVDAVQNTWERNSIHTRISVVTFGAPAMMFLQTPGTTAEMRKDLKKNVHHIINPDDIVPFAANWLLHKKNRAVSKTEQIIMEWLNTTNPSLGVAAFAAFKVLGMWKDNENNLAHYGSLYRLYPYEGNSGRTRQCTLVTAEGLIPSSPVLKSEHGLEFHCMDHYHDCMVNTIDWVRDSHNAIFPETKTLEDFRKTCMEPFEITDCEGIVHEDKVTITAKVKPFLARFFIKSVSHRMDKNGLRVFVNHFEFTNTASENQTQIHIRQYIHPNESIKTFTEMADAMQSLRIRTSFNKTVQIHVKEMKHVSMQDVSLTTTFESIRHAMIVALADQMEKVYGLKSETQTKGTEEGSSVDVERLEESRRLTRKADDIAKSIDMLVAHSSPHLVKAKLQDATQIVNQCWRTEVQHARSMDEKTRTGAYISETSALKMAENSDLIPDDCSEELRGLITRMHEDFKAANIRSPYTEETWTNQGQPKMSTQCRDIPSLTDTLRDFGSRLYTRTHITDPDKRIERAIKEVGEVLAVMRFCHIIIITQLDAPDGWCFKVFKEHVMKGVGMVASLATGAYTLYTTAGSVWSMYAMPSIALATGWAAFAGAVGVAAGFISCSMSAVAVEQLPHGPRHEQEMSFNPLLSMTIAALGGNPHSSGNPEASLTALLEQQSSKLEDFEYWKKRLEEGTRNDRSGLKYVPTLFWAKWMHDVARVGQLRTLVSKRLYIGIEGPTGVGKSSLLTTLIGENVFGAGSGISNRTMDLQSYSPPSLKAVFNDVPGCDDEAPHIREMARLFREMMGIIIFVIPSENVRSESTNTLLKGIAQFIRQRERPRPFRVLLNRVDGNIDEEYPNEVKKQMIELKKVVVAKIKEFGPFPENYVIQTRQAIPGGIKLGFETIEDVVYPFSTYAQMSRQYKKTLSDCDSNVRRYIKDQDKFALLFQLAESNTIWDIESLRGWLRGLAPDSVPKNTGRVPP